MKKNKVLINLILIILIICVFSQSLATEGTNEVVPEPPKTEEVAPPQNEVETPGSNQTENTIPETTPDNTTPPNNNEEQPPENIAPGQDNTQNGVTSPEQNEPDNTTPPEQNQEETVKPGNDNEHLETPNTSPKLLYMRCCLP